MTKHFPPPYVVTTRLERMVFVTHCTLPDLPTLFDDRDVEDNRDDFLAQVEAFKAFCAGAGKMWKRAGIDVDTDFGARLDDLVTDCYRVPLDERAQLLRDAA